MKCMIILAAILTALLPICLKAQEAEEAANTAVETAEDEEEMIVNADSANVQLDEDNHPVAIELEGNVSIEDVSMRFTAKKMTVHLDKNNKPINIEAVGGVTVRTLDGSASATGETGRYDAELDTVLLKGNCVILQEKNTIRGEQVVFDRKTGKIRLKGASLTLPLKKVQSGMNLGNLLKGKEKEEKTKDKSDGQKDAEADKKSDGDLQPEQKTNEPQEAEQPPTPKEAEKKK